MQQISKMKALMLGIYIRVSKKIQNSYAYTKGKELNAPIGRRNVLTNISIYKYEVSTKVYLNFVANYTY
jgi:hypothetical protein